MRNSFTVLLVFITIASLGWAAIQTQSGQTVPLMNSSPSPTSFEVAFSPDQGATDLVVKTIGEAKKTIRLAGYSFTSEPVAAALIAAHDRGVDVQIVIDERDNIHAKAAKTNEMQTAHIPIRLTARYKIMHDKFIVIDGDTVETGSFNYTVAAEHSNAENVIVMHSVPDLAAKYNAQWAMIWATGN